MTQPTQQPNLARPKYGFHDYVERLNGRAAMMGFFVGPFDRSFYWLRYLYISWALSFSFIDLGQTVM